MWPAATKKANDGGANDLYPAPLATHEEVVAQACVFWETLRRFHFLMDTKFMIPVIGGKELNLHVLYIEVSTRGGYEKVVAEKKWREVGCVFQFSSTTTSASFVLRKHYLSLLYHYEQVHFFRVQGPPSTPTGNPLANPFSIRHCVSASSFHYRPQSVPWLGIFSKRCTTSSPFRFTFVAMDSAALFPIRSSPPTGTPMTLVKYSIGELVHPLTEGKPSFYAVGTIEGKFDCGYLVSVQIGSQVLSGILYHPDGSDLLPSGHPLTSAVVPVAQRGRSGRAGRRRRNRRGRDPTYPKPNRSGYNFFFAEKHYKLKSLYPHREREFTKIIGQSWSSLSEEERMVYQNIGMKDKERYKRELKEYYEKHKHKIVAEQLVE